VAVVLPAGAAGRVWTVRADGTGDFPTFQAVIDTATAGDEIVVEPGHYTWENQASGNGHGLIQFERQKTGIWVHSSAGPQSTILDGQGLGRVVFIQGENEITPISLTFEGFTIINGVAPPDPTAGYAAGGGMAGHLADTIVRNCIFRNNEGRDGGAVWWGGVSAITFEDCVFENNHAAFGGGMLIVNSYLTAVLRRCTFRDNTASYNGGALYCVHNSFQLFDCAIASNSATLFGGALFCDSVHPSLLSGVTMVGNAASRGSGIYARSRAIWQENSKLAVERSVVAFNHSGLGLYTDSASRADFSCSNMFGNTGGDWIDARAAQLGINGNLCVDPLFCLRDGAYQGVCASSPCLSVNNACGLQLGAWGQGCTECGPEVVPQKVVLRQSLYNPYRPGFHSGALLPYTTTAPGLIDMKLYDTRGRLVRRLLHETQDAGEHLAVWDGRGDSGDRVASGVYILLLTVEGEAQTQKLTVIR
jgi:predicted outer membrane repeat protein